MTDNRPAVEVFIAALFDRRPAGSWLSGFATCQGKPNSTPWATSTATMVDDFIYLDEAGFDVYIGVATQKHQRSGRGTSADAVSIGALWLDVDVAGPGHAAANLPATMSEAIAWVYETAPVPPSALVASGGGLHVWWLLEEHLAAADAVVLLDRHKTWWMAKASERGWHLDSVFDLARVMRVPGTTNRKTGVPVEVVAIEHDWELRYIAPALLEAMPAVSVPIPLDTPTHHSRIVNGDGVFEELPGDSFNRQRTCGDVLAAEGWTLTKRTGKSEHWRHPNAHYDTSAEVFTDNGTCKVYTSSIPGLDPAAGPEPPFGLWAHLVHGGDFQRARQAAELDGYGRRRISSRPSVGAAALAPTDIWPDPLPLSDGPEGMPPWPVHVLPAWIGDHVLAVADAMRVPADLPAQFAIGALATVAMGNARIRIKPSWSEPLNVYLAIAAPSGMGKSPAVNLMTAPLRRLQHELVEAWEAEQEATADLPVPKKPKPRLLATDASPEVLAMLLAEHGNRIAMLSSEAELFDMVSGAYNQRPNLNVYLQAWDGQSFEVDRKGGNGTVRIALHLEQPLLTLCSAVQPSVLESVGRKGDLTGRGFLQRFMWARVEETERPDVYGQIAGDDAVAATAPDYAERLIELGHRLHAWLVEAELIMDRPARLAFAEWADALEARRWSGDLEHVAEFTRKLRGTVARIAGLLHLADGRSPREPVTTATVTRATELGDYWAAQARAIAVAQTIEHGDTVAAERLMAWAQRRSIDTFTAREAHRFLHSSFNRNGRYRQISEAESVLDLLEERRWVRLEDGAYGSMTVRVRPDLAARQSRDSARQSTVRPGRSLEARATIARQSTSAARQSFTDRDVPESYDSESEGSSRDRRANPTPSEQEEQPIVARVSRGPRDTLSPGSAEEINENSRLSRAPIREKNQTSNPNTPLAHEDLL